MPRVLSAFTGSWPTVPRGSGLSGRRCQAAGARRKGVAIHRGSLLFKGVALTYSIGRMRRDRSPRIPTAASQKTRVFGLRAVFARSTDSSLPEHCIGAVVHSIARGSVTPEARPCPEWTRGGAR